MSKPIYLGKAACKTLCLIIGFTLSSMAGWTFNAHAQTLTTLHSFNRLDGGNPTAGPVQGGDGNFYGTTSEGGRFRGGSVFRLSPSGVFTNLYSFDGGSNGLSPVGGLAKGSDGNFYGTTYNGGVNIQYGTVFRISSIGSLTYLHSFNGGDGAYPAAGLVLGSDGNFYGTTVSGGVSNNGTVFQINQGGDFTNLYSFSGNDGANPYAGLVQGRDGNFYGTTYAGGPSNAGTVFQISQCGNFTNLYAFSVGDGAQPYGNLVQGSDGNFYGTAQGGGTNHNGTVFQISPFGTFTNLYLFNGSDGANPNGGLVHGSDGNFYGTTRNGGGGGGTVFWISPFGSLTTLYSFSGGIDGNLPYAGLVQGLDGNFYGTSYFGGSGRQCPGGCGNVFEISVPLNPPANEISAVQIAGNDVTISIPSVAGEIYQLQFSSLMCPTNWVSEGGTITSIGSLLTVTNFGGALQPQGAYRFDIKP